MFTDWDGDGNLDLYVANYVDFDPQQLATLDCRLDPASGGEVRSRWIRSNEGLQLSGVEVFCGPKGLKGAQDKFFRNRGDGTFERWPRGVVDPQATYGLALLSTDCDGDQLADLYVATDSTMNLLYRHAPDGAVDDWSFLSGAALNGDGVAQAGMGVTAADYDADGDFDLLVTNFQRDYNTLYRNVGGCSFEELSELSGLGASTRPYMGWAALFFDVDGDADQDLFIANGHVYPQVDRLPGGARSSPTAAEEPEAVPTHADDRGVGAIAADHLQDSTNDPDSIGAAETYEQRNLLFMNQWSETGEARFNKSTSQEGGSGLNIEAVSRGAAAGDINNDGDFDLIVTNLNAEPTLLVNEGVMRWPLLRLTLVGRQESRSAYGTQVVVQAAGTRQWFELRHSDGYLGSNDPRLLIFLPGGNAERVEIRWSKHSTTELEDVQPGWLVVDQQHGVIARRAP